MLADPKACDINPMRGNDIFGFFVILAILSLNLAELDLINLLILTLALAVVQDRGSPRNSGQRLWTILARVLPRHHEVPKINRRVVHLPKRFRDLRS